MERQEQARALDELRGELGALRDQLLKRTHVGVIYSNHMTVYTDRWRVQVRIFSASAPPPSHSSESEDGDECNDPSTVPEPPTKYPQSHARPIRLGLHLFRPWVANLSKLLSQYVFNHHKLIMHKYRQVHVHDVRIHMYM